MLMSNSEWLSRELRSQLYDMRFRNLVPSPPLNWAKVATKLINELVTPHWCNLQKIPHLVTHRDDTSRGHGSTGGWDRTVSTLMETLLYLYLPFGSFPVVSLLNEEI